MTKSLYVKENRRTNKELTRILTKFQKPSQRYIPWIPRMLLISLNFHQYSSLSFSLSLSLYDNFIFLSIWSQTRDVSIEAEMALWDRTLLFLSISVTDNKHLYRAGDGLTRLNTALPLDFGHKQETYSKGPGRPYEVERLHRKMLLARLREQLTEETSISRSKGLPMVPE